MKLRNKKTGEIWDIGKVLTNDYPSYDTLEQITEDFEDYNSPLIKDEKIRKAVRAWAEANKIDKCKCSDETHCITFETERGMFISFGYVDPIPPEGNFTITELCGEEE